MLRGTKASVYLTWRGMCLPLLSLQQKTVSTISNQQLYFPSSHHDNYDASPLSQDAFSKFALSLGSCWLSHFCLNASQPAELSGPGMGAVQILNWRVWLYASYGSMLVTTQSTCYWPHRAKHAHVETETVREITAVCSWKSAIYRAISERVSQGCLCVYVCVLQTWPFW